MEPSQSKVHRKKSQKPKSCRSRSTTRGAPRRLRKRQRNGNPKPRTDADDAVTARYRAWCDNIAEQLESLRLSDEPATTSTTIETESSPPTIIETAPTIIETESSPPTTTTTIIETETAPTTTTTTTTIIETETVAPTTRDANLVADVLEATQGSSRSRIRQRRLLGPDREYGLMFQELERYSEMFEKENLDFDELSEALTKAKDAWHYDWDDKLTVPANLHNWYHHVFTHLGLDFENLNGVNSGQIDNGYINQMSFIARLRNAFIKCIDNSLTAAQADEQEDPSKHIDEQINRIYRNIYYMTHSARAMVKAWEVLAPSYDYLNDNDTDVMRYAPPDQDDCTSFQKLLLYVLHCLSEKGYRKYGDDCYRAIYNEDRHYTFAWESVVELKAFIHQICRKETNFTQWCWLTDGGANRAEQIAKFLQEGDDQQFPELIKDRHMFAFSDGLYVTKVETDEGRFEDVFYPYTNVDWSQIDPKKVACNYFKSKFYQEDPQDWYDIQTPHFQSVLDYQWSAKVQEDKGFKMTAEQAEEICRWLYVFMGRMLYELGELGERWEVAPFLIGIGGCGKSTISNCVSNFYDEADVGYVSNNIDKTFGIAALKDNFICVAPEIHDNFALDQTEFQKIISGEPVKIREMYKDPKHVSKWKIPWFLVGNASANYDDKQGQISRRLVFFFFNIKVKDSDKKPYLDRKLKKEMPALLKKCNRAYLDYVNKYKDKDIWNILPQYFKNLQNRFNKNPLYEFLRQDNVKFGPDCYVPWDTFKSKFIGYCQVNNWGNQRLNREDCGHIFAKFTDDLSLTNEIHVRDAVVKDWPPGSNSMKKGTYILGITFRDISPIIMPFLDDNDEGDETAAEAADEDIEMDEAAAVAPEAPELLRVM